LVPLKTSTAATLFFQSSFYGFDEIRFPRSALPFSSPGIPPAPLQLVARNPDVRTSSSPKTECKICQDPRDIQHPPIPLRKQTRSSFRWEVRIHPHSSNFSRAACIRFAPLFLPFFSLHVIAHALPQVSLKRASFPSLLKACPGLQPPRTSPPSHPPRMAGVFHPSPI